MPTMSGTVNMPIKIAIVRFTRPATTDVRRSCGFSLFTTDFGIIGVSHCVLPLPTHGRRGWEGQRLRASSPFLNNSHTNKLSTIHFCVSVVSFFHQSARVVVGKHVDSTSPNLSHFHTFNELHRRAILCSGRNGCAAFTEFVHRKPRFYSRQRYVLPAVNIRRSAKWGPCGRGRNSFGATIARLGWALC